MANLTVAHTLSKEAKAHPFACMYATLIAAVFIDRYFFGSYLVTIEGLLIYGLGLIMSLVLTLWLHRSGAWLLISIALWTALWMTSVYLTASLVLRRLASNNHPSLRQEQKENIIAREDRGYVVSQTAARVASSEESPR